MEPHSESTTHTAPDQGIEKAAPCVDEGIVVSGEDSETPEQVLGQPKKGKKKKWTKYHVDFRFVNEALRWQRGRGGRRGRTAGNSAPSGHIGVHTVPIARPNPRGGSNALDLPRNGSGKTGESLWIQRDAIQPTKGDSEALRMVTKQLEYYLSEINLLKDRYLRRNMDSDGWVAIAVISPFKRMLELVSDKPDSDLHRQIIALAAQKSEKLVVSHDQQFIRTATSRRWPLPAAPGTMAPWMMAPQTMAPQTMAPQTMAPQTMAPQMMAQQMIAPLMAPQTMAPKTMAPQMIAPQTMAPQTMAPQTTAPQMMAPQTMAPQMMARQTMAPQTMVPQTMAPQTMVPQTMAPQTMAQQMMAPQTMAPPQMMAPQRVAPNTMAPQTMAPQTMALPTMAPPTMAPQTMAPQMMAPQMMAPQMMAPQTMAPQTMAPQMMAPQTMAPPTMAPPTMAPQMMAPQMMAPQMAPQTISPQTMAPQMMAPQTMAPQTMAPQTMAPPTMAPQTMAPQTMANVGGGTQWQLPPCVPGNVVMLPVIAFPGLDGIFHCFPYHQ